MQRAARSLVLSFRVEGVRNRASVGIYLDDRPQFGSGTVNGLDPSQIVIDEFASGQLAGIHRPLQLGDVPLDVASCGRLCLAIARAAERDEKQRQNSYDSSHVQSPLTVA